MSYEEPPVAIPRQWLTDEEIERRQQAEREYGERQRAREMARVLRATGVPLKDIGLIEASEVKATDAMVYLEQHAEATMLVLSGPSGVGKSTAAGAWVAGYVRDARNWTDGMTPSIRCGKRIPLFVTAPTLTRLDRYDDEKTAPVFKAKRLVIDDLGTEYVDKNGFFLALLDELINERYAERRPTIITTNLGAEAFKQRYGERIIDRIREAGAFIAIAGKSLRGGKQ